MLCHGDICMGNLERIDVNNRSQRQRGWGFDMMDTSLLVQLMTVRSFESKCEVRRGRTLLLFNTWSVVMLKVSLNKFGPPLFILVTN